MQSVDCSPAFTWLLIDIELTYNYDIEECIAVHYGTEWEYVLHCVRSMFVFVSIELTYNSVESRSKILQID